MAKFWIALMLYVVVVSAMVQRASRSSEQRRTDASTFTNYVAAIKFVFCGFLYLELTLAVSYQFNHEEVLATMMLALLANTFATFVFIQYLFGQLSPFSAEMYICIFLMLFFGIGSFWHIYQNLIQLHLYRLALLEEEFYNDRSFRPFLGDDNNTEPVNFDTDDDDDVTGLN